MGGQTPPNAKGWVVLIVDDQLDNVMIAQAALEFFGAKVEIALNGQEALRILERMHPTAILLDLAMPVMDGFVLHKRLREMSALDKVPIIALTANAMSADRERVMEAGFDDYIAKPYDVLNLANHIAEAMKKRNPD